MHASKGISDDGIRHAANNAIAAITNPDQPDFTMLLGPDPARPAPRDRPRGRRRQRLRHPRHARTTQIPHDDLTQAR